MGSSQFGDWYCFAGGKVISGLLIGAGILVMITTQFLQARLSHVGFVLGLFIVVVGIIATSLAFLTDREAGRDW